MDWHDMRLRCTGVAVAVTLASLGLAGAAHADITGTVTTPSGVPVAGATVRASDAAGGGAGYSTATDAYGAYRIELTPSTSDPAPFTVRASVTDSCRSILVQTASGPVPDGAVQPLTLDAQLFCAASYVSSALAPATAYVWPERAQVLSPPGGQAYLRVLAPYRASGFALTLSDGTTVGTSDRATAIPLRAPASYQGPLNLTYTVDGVSVTRELATLIAGEAPSAAQATGPLDLAAIVDVSGSMSGSDPTNRRTDALQLVVDLASPGDRLAGIGFDNDVRDIFARTTVTGPSSKATLKHLARERIGNFGGTDYNVGFDTGFDALTVEPLNAATPKGAIFLTDGAHNGTYDNSHLKFAFNGTGHSWPVCVVELGKEFSAADTARLKRIARETGGTFVKTPTNTELENLYFQCLGRATGAHTLLRSTRTFHVGQTQSYARKVKHHQRKATFFVSFARGRYALRLRQPGGRVYKRSTGKDVRLVRSKTFSFFEVKRPRAGRWTLSVKRLRTGRKLDRATTTITVQRRR